MRLALVLGAGATLAHARHLRSEGHSGDLPPLDNTFFERISELGIPVDASLRVYAGNLLGTDPFEPGEGKPGMESFFKDVFYDFISSRSKTSRAAQRYGGLVVAYRTVLLKTTNWVCDHAEDGPVAALLAEAANAADHLDIITFNHDLLVENTLADLDAANGRWCLRHGYGHFSAKRRFTFQKGTRTFDDPNTCTHSNPIRLYKLHGSLNWYVDSDSPVPDAAVLRGERDADQRIMVTRRRSVPSNLHRKGGEYSWPVLIPPIYAKQPFISNFMAPVWQDARRALAACDRLVFFGYSMPTFDIEAEKEFQRAIARNRKLAHVDLVNPSTDSATRYAEAFPRRSVHWHSNLEHFLDGQPFG